jgi:hypothetical protein
MSQKKGSQNNDGDANENIVDAIRNDGNSNGIAAKPINGPTSASGLPHPDRFRIPQNFAEHVMARKKAVVVPMKKPDDQEWVFIHPSKDWRSSIGMLKDKANREYFAVEPELLPEITENLVPMLLVAYVTRAGSPGLWPIRLPNEAGRQDSYNRSALEIVYQHSGEWIRVVSNEGSKTYEIWQMKAQVEMPIPNWPEGGFAYLFGIAIKGNIITTLEHPLLKTLRGEL